MSKPGVVHTQRAGFFGPTCPRISESVAAYRRTYPFHIIVAFGCAARLHSAFQRFKRFVFRRAGIRKQFEPQFSHVIHRVFRAVPFEQQQIQKSIHGVVVHGNAVHSAAGIGFARTYPVSYRFAVGNVRPIVVGRKGVAVLCSYFLHIGNGVPLYRRSQRAAGATHNKCRLYFVLQFIPVHLFLLDENISIDFIVIILYT